MRGAVLLGDRRAVVRDFPDPTPGPGEVVIRMRVAAVCGSDLHRYRSTPEELRDFGAAGRIPGHEPSGEVVLLGEGVHNVKLGDRVAVYHYLGCGRCRHCLSGFMQWCPDRRGLGWHVHGSDADFLLVNEVNCLPLPAELTYVDGAFIACQASTTYSAMLKLGPSGRDTMVVFGLGPVGMCGVMIGKALGARIIGVDLVEERLELAHKLGAEEVIHGGKENVVARLQALTDGAGPDLAYETSGSSAAQQTAVEALRRAGKVAFVGIGKNMSVDLRSVVNKQLVIMGSFVSPIGMYWELAAFLVRQRVALEAMVTHRFGIEEAPEAFRLADSAKSGKIVFEWTQ